MHISMHISMHTAVCPMHIYLTHMSVQTVTHLHIHLLDIKTNIYTNINVNVASACSSTLTSMYILRERVDEPMQQISS